MLQAVSKYIEDHSLLSPGSTVVVGFSGGADSVVLLHVLKSLGYVCVAAHCNFHLRGEESLRDERFSRAVAEQMTVPFEQIDFDTFHHAEVHKLSIEMAARELRYRWFEELRVRWNAEAIAVGHHRDDCVETVLLNLVRGTGIRGLVGIRAHSGRVVRPLLSIEKEEILRYIEAHRLHYVTDSTNLEEVYVRNKLRLQVLPLLAEINPSVSEAIQRTATNLLQVEKVYNDTIQRAKKNVLSEREGHYYIRIDLLKQFASPGALLYEILSDYSFNPSVIEKVKEALDAQPGKLFYSSTHRLLKDREYLILTLWTDGLDPEEAEILISADKKLFQGVITLQIDTFLNTPGLVFERNEDVAYFDADRLKPTLRLRKWREKDWFIPFGMNGRQKISKYFKDHKFNKVEKEAAWLLCSGEEVVWIVGKRADNRFRVVEETTNICRITLVK